MIFKINFNFIAIIFFSFSLSAQNWFPNETQNRNFYELQKSFNDYWRGKKIEKGKGFKQFKRWEWYWKNRVKPDGSFYSAGITIDNFNEYLRNHNQNFRSLRNVANWESLGPTNTPGGYAGTGRINSLAFNPTNSNIIYAGAAGGGLWQSNDGGVSWFTNTDNLATLGVSAILVDPVNPNIIYIGTGDGDAADNYSVGVLKSTDGGVTFNTTGLNWSITNFRLIRRMVFDPDNNNTIIAATSEGIYRTTNAGVNWTKETSGSTSFQDVEPNPLASTNTFYATAGANIYKSTNNGDTWSLVQSISNTNRIALAVTPANNTYVYALCSKSSGSGFRGLYRSTDSGQTYNERSTSPNILGWAIDGSDADGQGWYDLIIAADPLNAETIYTGGVTNWKSTNGGTTFTLNSFWYNAGGVSEVHADKHAFEWQNNTTLWQGTDGGVYKTTNGTNWLHFGDGLVTSQMYRIGVSQTDTKAIIGLQDNGTKQKFNTNNWLDALGGDGMDCAIQHTNSATMYGSLYYGDFSRTTNGGSSWSNISPASDGNWVTPFVIDPINPSTIYAGYTQLYKSTDKGSNWVSIGSFSDGISLDYLAVSPSNVNYIYAGIWNKLWRTTDGGTAWIEVNTPNNSTSMVVLHPTDTEILWAVSQNYSGGQKVFKSINGGTSWTNISGTLPNIPANCLVYQLGSDDGLYIGMDIGVYYKDNSMSDWELYNAELPNVEITDLEINYFEDKLYAGTYGRGLWSSELISPCERPRELSMIGVSPFTATILWENSIVPANGYEWSLGTTSTPPANGTIITSNSQQLTGLTSNTNYFFFVRANCGGGNFSPWAMFNFKHKYICSGSNFDSGGNGNNYPNVQDFVDVICPSSSDAAMRLTFNSFNTENQYDALYIHNGKDINAPLFASNNPTTLAGFPPGGYYGNTSIGPFTSTDTTGCITLHFLSDNSSTASGWNAVASCVLHCSPLGVTNLNNDGWGSLRRAIACAAANDTLDVSSHLAGQLLVLNSPIVINKNLNLLQSAATYLKIKANTTGPIFEIPASFTLSLSHLELYGGNGTKGRAISNNGILNMKNIKVFEDVNAPQGGSLIFNQGTINVNDSNEIHD